MKFSNASSSLTDSKLKFGKGDNIMTEGILGPSCPVMSSTVFDEEASLANQILPGNQVCERDLVKLG